MEFLEIEEFLKEKGFSSFNLKEQLPKEEKIFQMEAECRFQTLGVFSYLTPNQLWIEMIGTKRKALRLLLFLYQKIKGRREKNDIQARKIEKPSLFYLQQYAIYDKNKRIAYLSERRMNQKEIMVQKESLKEQMEGNKKYVLLKQYYPLRTIGIDIDYGKW